MKGKFGLKQLILLTAVYLVFELIDYAIDQSTGIHWISPRDFSELLGLSAIALLWIWYFVDKIRKK